MSALKRGGKKAFFCNDIAKAKIIGGVQSVLFQEGNFWDSGTGGFLWISLNFPACNFIRNETTAQVFSWEFPAYNFIENKPLAQVFSC